MSQVAHSDQSSPVLCPPLPLAAGLVAVFGVLAELALIADEGIAGLDDPGVPISMTLTALVVTWASYGVLAGRTVRLVLVSVVLTMSALGYAWDAVDRAAATDWPLLHLLLTLAMAGALVALVRSPFHRWQRAHHDLSRAPVVGVLLLAALCGGLGPLSAEPEPTVQVNLRL
jgi:hypothetical protein